MDKEKLTYFISAASHLSFTKAAADCHVVQGTISKQMAALEKELNVKLFVRKGQVLELTEAGKRLYADSNDYLEQYTTIENNLKKLYLAFTDNLSLAVGTMEQPLVVDSLKDFYKRCPDININFSTYTYRRMAAHFRNGTLDIGFCCNKCADTISEVKKIEVYKKPWLVCAAESSPFWQMSRADRSVLKGQTVISIIGDKYDVVFDYCRENDMKHKDFYFTNAAISQWALLESGIGVAVLPAFMEGKVDGVRFEDSLEKPLDAGFSVVYSEKKSKKGAIEKYMEYFKKI